MSARECDFRWLSCPEHVIKKNTNMMAISWKSIGYFILNKMKNQYGFLCSYYTGEFLDLETMVYIKESALYYGSNSLKSLSEKTMNNSVELVNEDFDSNYLLKLSNFEKKSRTRTFSISIFVG